MTWSEAQKLAFSEMLILSKSYFILKFINTGWPRKNVPNFAQLFSRSLSRYEGGILQVYWTSNLEHVRWISSVLVNILLCQYLVMLSVPIDMVIIFFASFFIGTRERKDLQQPAPQRSVSALTALHCSLLCPMISCLMWLGCHVHWPLSVLSSYRLMNLS